MIWFVVIGCVIAAGGTLSVMAAERERMVLQVETEILRDAKAAAEQAEKDAMAGHQVVHPHSNN